MSTPESGPLKKGWNEQVSLHASKEIHSILLEIERYAGVQLTGGMAADELKSYTATDLLNFAESVLVDTDLWNQVPDEFEDDQGIKTFNKEVVKKDLQDLLNRCRG